MKLRAGAVIVCLASAASSAAADPFLPWNDDPYWERPAPREQRYRDDTTPPAPAQPTVGEEVRDGGPRPEIAPKAPIVVAFPIADYAPGSIVIDSGGRKLYFVLPGSRAFQYPISVGREGFAWAGTEKISRKQAWPDWHPPVEMRKRDPKLPAKMLGGVKNPLGAMALYLGNTLYRIHGTNDERTIGHASSSGCFRMMNSAVLHLSQFAQVGTPVTVVNQLPLAPTPPPVASARPPAFDRDAGVEANRPARLPPPQQRNWSDEDQDEEPDRADNSGSRYEGRDVANVTVTPRRNVDDYDPYVARRSAPDRYAGSRYGDDWPRRRNYADSYDRERSPRDRVWHDDWRDDY